MSVAYVIRWPLLGSYVCFITTRLTTVDRFITEILYNLYTPNLLLLVGELVSPALLLLTLRSFCGLTPPVADLHSKILDVRPLGAQILSISCSFWEFLAKSYVGAPPGELVPPPLENPGSATALYTVLCRLLNMRLGQVSLVGVSECIRQSNGSIFRDRSNYCCGR